MDQQLHSALGRATRNILRPLVRILLRAGVPCGVFIEQAKRVYVEVGRSEFSVARRKPSISRTAVLTGLTRKEVSRLWKEPASAAEPAIDKYNRAARVITGWVRDSQYADARGGPASLPFSQRPGVVGPSFVALVAKHSGDMPPRSVLDELLRVGAVEQLKNGNLRLIERAYVPAKGQEEKLAILGADVAELLSTIDHNISSERSAARFQRKVLYNNLPLECLETLRESAADASQSLLEKLDAQMSGFDRDSTSLVEGTGRATASVGIYYYEEIQSDEVQDENRNELPGDKPESQL